MTDSFENLSNNYVLIGKTEKIQHQKRVCQLVRDGGEIPLFNSNFAIQFISKGRDWVEVQVVAYNNGQAPEKQTHIRPKIVKITEEKIIEKDKSLDLEKSQKTLDF